MKRIAVFFTFFDDIKIVYGNLISNDSLTVRFPRGLNISADEIESAFIYFFSTKENIPVKIKEIFEDKVFFEELQVADNKFLRGHWVNYKNSFSLVLLDDNNSKLYNQRCLDINLSAKNKLAIGLRETVNRADNDNRELFSFLFQINSKLDEILSILKPISNAENMYEVVCSAVSTQGILFFSKTTLDTNVNVFLQGNFCGFGEHFDFALIGKPDIIKLNPDGTGIYKLSFAGLEDDIKDGIVRFIFAKEREILKEARIDA